MDLVLLELLRGSRSDGVGDDAGSTGRETAGGDLHDLAAINLTDDALDEHLLGLVTVAHEGGVLLEEVGKAVGAESNTALIRDVAVAETLHALEEQ